MVKVGDKVTEAVGSIGRSLAGRVVYVHPQGRFYIVEFQVSGGSFRESFTEARFDGTDHRTEAARNDRRNKGREIW